jgi:hypothetical protein
VLAPPGLLRSLPQKRNAGAPLPREKPISHPYPPNIGAIVAENQQLSPDEYLQRYGITAEDLERVRRAGVVLEPQLPKVVDSFYEWLPSLGEYR